jgi:hypothetical protein
MNKILLKKLNISNKRGGGACGASASIKIIIKINLKVGKKQSGAERFLKERFLKERFLKERF